MNEKKRTEEEKVNLCKRFLENRGWVVTRPQAVAYESGNRFPPLAHVTKPMLTTEEAAFYLNRKAQTLRAWACKSGVGPIQPISIGGRNGWRTEDVRKLVGG